MSITLGSPGFKFIRVHVTILRELISLVASKELAYECSFITCCTWFIHFDGFITRKVVSL